MHEEGQVNWQHEQVKDNPPRYVAIRCFTCEQFVPGKRFLKAHMGHSVHYVNEKGEVLK